MAGLTIGDTYYVRVFDYTGTTDPGGPFTICAFSPCIVPTITVNSIPAICVGTTLARLPYSATTGSPDQYSIDFDNAANTAGFVDVVNAALPASPIAITVPGAPAGTYNGSLTVRNSTTGCVSAVSAITVTINALPAATISAGGTYCTGGTPNDVTATVTGTGPWSVAYTLDGSAQPPATGGVSPIILNNLPGTYALTGVTDANCTNTATGSAIITVQPISDAPVITGPYCSGATAINGSSGEADGTVIEVFVNNVSVGTTLVAGGAWTKSGLSPLAGGSTITAKAQAAGKCQSPNSSIHSVQNTADAPTVNGPICAGGGTVSGGSTESNGSIVTIYINGGSVGTTTVSGGAWTSSPLSFVAGMQITAKAEAMGECVSAVSNTVTVSASPTVTCPADMNVCVNDAAFILTGGSPTGGSYTGRGVDGFGCGATLQADNTDAVSAVGNTFNPACAGVGTHTISYTYNNGSCSNRCTFTITVTALPANPTGMASQNVCGSVIAALQLNVGSGNIKKWYDAATNGNAYANGDAIVEGQDYWGVAVNSKGCESATRFKVTVAQIYTTPVTNITPATQTVCVNGTPTTLTVNITSGDVSSYSWVKNTTNDLGGATPISGASSSTYIPPTNATGTTYYWCLIGEYCTLGMFATGLQRL